jgi:hypothetical protein
MKNLFQLTLVVLVLTSLNANASIEIKSAELFDSTIINGSEITAITLHDDDSSIESIEMTDGTILEGSSVKRLHFSNKLNSKFNSRTAVKVGGEGTGG